MPTRPAPNSTSPPFSTTSLTPLARLPAAPALLVPREHPGARFAPKHLRRPLLPQTPHHSLSLPSTHPAPTFRSGARSRALLLAPHHCSIARALASLAPSSSRSHRSHLRPRGPSTLALAHNGLARALVSPRASGVSPRASSRKHLTHAQEAPTPPQCSGSRVLAPVPAPNAAQRQKLLAVRFPLLAACRAFLSCPRPRPRSLRRAYASRPRGGSVAPSARHCSHGAFAPRWHPQSQPARQHAPAALTAPTRRPRYIAQRRQQSHHRAPRPRHFALRRHCTPACPLAHLRPECLTSAQIPPWPSRRVLLAHPAPPVILRLLLTQHHHRAALALGFSSPPLCPLATADAPTTA